MENPGFTDAEVDEALEQLIADGMVAKAWDDERHTWKYKLTDQGRELALAIKRQPPGAD